MPEIRKALWDRRYIVLIISGGITGFVQVNDTHLHKQLKNEYRKKESVLMLEKLTKDLKKIPSPDRSEMMSLLVESEKAIALDPSAAFKSLWVINSHGSEHYLASDKIFSLVGDNRVRQFRNEMITKSPPKTVKKVIRSLIPAKDIKRGKISKILNYLMKKKSKKRKMKTKTRKKSMPINFSKVSLETFQSNERQKKKQCNVVTGNSVSLVGITESDQINNDAKFLDEIKKFLTNMRHLLSLPQLETNSRTRTDMHEIHLKNA